MKVENHVVPTEQQMTDWAGGDNESGPIYMVNLLKFKDKAEYTDGRETDLSGRDAYALYGAEVAKMVLALGGQIRFGAEVSFLQLGEVEELWDQVAIAEYPNRKAMFEMATSKEYQKIAVHRDAGLKGQLNIETRGFANFG